MDVMKLLWIIPCSVLLGIAIGLSFSGSSKNNREWDIYQEGYNKGLADRNKEKINLPGMIITLEEIYDRELHSDFNKFIEITGGIIYNVEPSGQMCMIYIDDTDTLSQYFDYDVIQICDEGKYQRFIIEKHNV